MLTELKKLGISTMHNLKLLELKKCKNVGGEFEIATNSRGQGALIKVDASEVSHSNVDFPNLRDLKINNSDSLVQVGALPNSNNTTRFMVSVLSSLKN